MASKHSCGNRPSTSSSYVRHARDMLSITSKLARVVSLIIQLHGIVK